MNIKVPYAILESAQLCRAKNDVRYYLNGIAFLPHGRVAATNGYILFAGNKYESSKPLKETLIFDIQKAPVRKYHHAIINDVNNLVTYHNDSGEQIAVGMIKPIDGRFPDIDRVINVNQEPTDVIGFNCDYLGMLPKIGKKFGNKFNFAKFTLSGINGAAKAELKNPFGDKGVLVVMPARI